jgi:hypothetical protein
LVFVIGLTADFHPQKGEEENKQKRKILNERKSALVCARNGNRCQQGKGVFLKKIKKNGNSEVT